VRIYQVYLAGLTPPRRPVANLLFLGPTGSGKTHLVEMAAEVLCGDSRAVVKVDCGEFQHSHEIAKLVGFPPGYLGHRETGPLITQEVLESGYTDQFRLSLVLFDEIEKASNALWQLLLGIMDKATLTLGDNRRVDFSRTMIFLTSNLGTKELGEVINGGIGFSGDAATLPGDLDRRIYRTALEATRRKFPHEFLNRLDKVIVFRPLERTHLEKILDLELTYVENRIRAARHSGELAFRYTKVAREFLLREGTNAQFGARHLKRTLERHLVFPMANLLATEQICAGDSVTVDYSPTTNELVFSKAEPAVIPLGREYVPAQTTPHLTADAQAAVAKALAMGATQK